MEAAARICVPLRSRWSLILRTFVSWCMWSVGVVAVQPVIIFSALFCMVWRVLWCVSARFEAQAGLAYSITERMNCLYTVVVVSLLCPNVVWASDLRALSLGVTLFFIFVMCCLKVIDVLYVTPRILGVCVCVRGVLSMVRCGVCWCSWLSLVSRVTVDLAVARLSLFVVHQWCSMLN